MNRASLSVTTVALVALLALFAPRLLPDSSAHAPAPVPVDTRCAAPTFGPADTDAMTLCVAAEHAGG